MKRGFPRPTVKIGKLATYSLVSRGLQDKYGNRTYPIPYSARTDKISRVRYGRIRECQSFKRCVVCGDSVKDQEVMMLMTYGMVGPDSGPFHPKCAKLTEAMCPVVKEQMKSGPNKNLQRFSWERMDWPLAQARLRRAYEDDYADADIDDEES